ncbi:MAG: hypothetical protein ACXWFS_01770 [Thermoanaerobaculia bacterium]
MLDNNLQTEVNGLYVCDASAFPEALSRSRSMAGGRGGSGSMRAECRLLFADGRLDRTRPRSPRQEHRVAQAGLRALLFR